MSLLNVPVKTAVRVTRVLPGPVTNRLMEIGLFEGAIVRVLGRAPLGGPLDLSLGDSRISLGRADAALVEFQTV